MIHVRNGKVFCRICMAAMWPRDTVTHVCRDTARARCSLARAVRLLCAFVQRRVHYLATRSHPAEEAYV